MASPWLDVLDDTIRACAAHERQDLVDRLRVRRAQLVEPRVRVLVFGEPSQGKSQLVNGLLNAPVCAVGDDLTTTAPVVIRHASEPVATLVTGGDDEARAIEGPGHRPVPIESAAARANADETVVRAEVGLPRELLAKGLTLIDTPPVGAPTARHTRNALAALQQADAALLVSDATKELSSSELDLLTRVCALCPTVVVVLTKIDMVPGWRRVAERNQAHLARGGLPVTVLPVSASLRLAAARAGDTALNEESGFGALVQYLHRDLIGHADLLRRRSVAALTRLTADQLTAPLRERLAAAKETDTDELTARWRAAGRKLEELQRESQRWQTLLSDEVADLVADLDFDLRDRTRRILREVDEYFEVADPAKDWDEFAEWMYENLRAVAETNSNWLLDRFEWIARKIARQVAPRGSGSLRERWLESTQLDDHVGELRRPAIERFGVGQKLFVGMRGSYSGLLMFGLATTLAGMSLINPISIGAGAAFGAKSVFEERGNRLKRRQSAARTAAHRYVDDFFLIYGKESKDTVRMIHRDLRDRCTAVAQELRVEITESAKRIKEVIDTETAQRTARVRELSKSIDELTSLRRRAQSLTAAGTVRGLTA
ncbi:dynamin family protein [Prauserella shujinwangii]|uniref:Dynamin family protein n=2 Tax=Prauserella shujinwangii TaxID=1453103 RepID=A0A2T0LN95_9PSEU|nr:dynamin family protein [Prauserella shujinwangii]